MSDDHTADAALSQSMERNRSIQYDPGKSYRWNYEHPPIRDFSPQSENASCHFEILEERVAAGTQQSMGRSWDFLGLPVTSPLGVAAGPLLNGAWCLYYASLGFDVLTYKTVRSVARKCYELPNLVPVNDEMMSGSERVVTSQEAMGETWAVSFGMPSSPPDLWRRDIQQTRNRLGKNQVLSVSVVGTQQEGWGLDELAEDYALCAKWALESGADAIEANFSCPNVSTCDGQLYQNAAESRLVASAIRRSIGKTPLVIKIGYLHQQSEIHDLISSLDGIVDGLSMTNSLAAGVLGKAGEALFEGQKRGICGGAIRDASVRQVAGFDHAKKELGSKMKLIGVGGIRTASHVQAYLDAGATACHLATAIMTDPLVGNKILNDLKR